MKTRKLTPEILDHLPVDDPDAIRSRSDLKKVNELGGNFRWMLSRLRGLEIAPGAPVIELGAGDGTFASYLSKHFPDTNYTALDLAPRPEGFPDQWQWRQQDIFDGLELDSDSIVLANLFLHHFTDDQLGQLGESLKNCRALIFSEPERNVMFRGLGCLTQTVFQFNHVTKHDMHVSIEAGFKGMELINAMHLENRKNHLEHSLLGFYRLVSKHRS